MGAVRSQSKPSDGAADTISGCFLEREADTTGFYRPRPARALVVGPDATSAACRGAPTAERAVDAAQLLGGAVGGDAPQPAVGLRGGAVVVTASTETSMPPTQRAARL